MSTVAFARDPYGLKPAPQADLSLLVPFNGNSGDPADYKGNDNDATTPDWNAVSFDVVLKDSTGAIVGTPTTYQATISTSTGKASVTIPAGIMTPSAIYTVELYKTSDTGHVTRLSKSTAVVYDGHNADMYKAGVDANGNPANSANVDVTGSGLVNANQTGYNNTRKQRSGQSLHGSYQNNTNSCATCHQTHTAKDGDFLLFKDGTYSTCSACHDGTTGAYNSFAPVSAEDTESVVGTFDVHGAGQNGSLHQADGSLQLTAAPGGSASSSKFAQDFDCASCHNAHGSGSTGENNLNVDPMNWGRVPYSETVGQVFNYYKGHGMTAETVTAAKLNDYKNGKLFLNVGIFDSVPASKSTPYILVRSTVADPSTNTFYQRAGVPAGSLVIQTYRWSASKYVPDYSLWLREMSYPFTANTVFFSTPTQSWDAEGNPQNSLNMDSGLKIVWRDAFAFGPSVANIQSANISLGIDVETTSNTEDLWSGAVPDSGIEMSKYCGSCHVDYLSETRTVVTGSYTTAHRHANVSRDELTCVRCHYAHGSEAQIMHDSNDNTYYDLTAGILATDGTTKVFSPTDALNYLVDTNPSSALKRYTGMSVCYACHGGGETFVGSPRNDKADTTTKQFLMSGQPGAERATVSK